jgi:hypothetical protein
MESVALAIAILALAVASLEVWLNYLRLGDLRMTRPTLICLLPSNGADPEKVWLRTLLYSTSHRGQMIENIYVCLWRAETKWDFTFWAYGDEEIVVGSGLFVGPDGVTHTHRFLLPSDSPRFEFGSGSHTIHVYAKRVRDPRPRLIGVEKLHITDAQAREVRAKGAGIFFEWSPNRGQYVARVESAPLFASK